MILIDEIIDKFYKQNARLKLIKKIAEEVRAEVLTKAEIVLNNLPLTEKFPIQECQLPEKIQPRIKKVIVSNSFSFIYHPKIQIVEDIVSNFKEIKSSISTNMPRVIEEILDFRVHSYLLEPDLERRARVAKQSVISKIHTPFFWIREFF